MQPITIPSGSDIIISLHAVDQHSDWPAATLNLSDEKSRLQCGLTSELFDYLLLLLPL